MAWTAISNGQIDTDSPVTQSLMTAYRDNFPALAAGNAGAPRILSTAHGTPATGSVGAGAIMEAGSGVMVTEPSSTRRLVGSWNALSNGVVRIQYQQLYVGGSAGDTCAVEIYKGGSLVNTQTTQSGSAVQRTYDVAIAGGVNLTVAVRKSAGTGGGHAAVYDVKVLQDMGSPVVGA